MLRKETKVNGNPSRVFCRGLLDLLNGIENGEQPEQHDDPLQHAHADADEMVAELLEEDDPDTVEG